MPRKEIAFVCVVAISVLFIVSADTETAKSEDGKEIISDHGLIDDEAEHEIAISELPKNISSDRGLIDDVAEHEFAISELPSKISSDDEPLNEDGERETSMISESAAKIILNLTCTSPPEIEGSILPQVHGNEHVIGTSVTYSCNYGYVSRNSINHISTCVKNKTTGRAEWTVPEIACIPRSCGDPGYVSNGRRIGNLFSFPNKVEFECQEGYRLVGMRSRFCQAGGDWSGRLPFCEPILCNIPPDVINGEVMYSSLEYGSELIYKCYLGYMESHKETRYCDVNGTWSGEAPECIETRCTKPIPPEHGEVHLIGEPKVGSIATFSCNPGLKLRGASATKCLITGQWTFDSPKCLRSCTVRLVENGEIGTFSAQRISRWKTEETFTPVFDGEHVDDGVTLSFRCYKNSAIVESDNILDEARIDVTCYDGRWSRKLLCKQTSCWGHPPEMKNGKAMVGARTHGHTIWYECNNKKDTKIEGNVTCHFGTWIGNTPQCLSEKPCSTKDLDFPGLMKPLQETVLSSKSFDINCKNGFILSTTANIVCKNGQWSITEDPCPLADEDTERRRTGNVSPSPVKVEDRAPSSSSNHPEPPPPEECSCTYVGAGYHVQASVGGKKLKDGDKVRKGQMVTFSCKGQRMLIWQNGFRTHGNANVTCKTCQRWEVTDNPDCKVLEFGGIFTMLGSTLEIRPGGVVEVLINQPITLRCISTYHYPTWSFQSQPIAVDYHNTWPGASALHYFSEIQIPKVGYDNAGLYECHIHPSVNIKRTVVAVKVKDNGCPLIVSDLIVSYSSGNQIGSWATFSCPGNAVLVGNYQIVCQVDGTWSSEKPHCQDILCTLFPTFQDLKVSYSDHNRVGSRATFSCPTQATLVGSEISDCRSDGTWNNPAPFCTNKTTCAYFTRTSEVSIGYSNGNFPGSSASFSCSPEKVLNGHSSALCLENGTWSHTMPSCEDKCSIGLISEYVKEGIVPDMSVVTHDLVPFGSTVPLMCEGKQIPDGNSTAVCGKHGRWKIEKFSCVSGCFLNIKPSSHLQVQPLKNSYRFGENVILSCPKGKKMSTDVELLMCLGYQTWSDSFPDCIES